MKGRRVRRLCAMLLLLAVVFCSAACGKPGAIDPPADTEPTEPGTGTAEPGSSGTRLTLSNGFLAGYTVVKPQNAAQELNTAVDSLLEKLSDLTGTRFRMTEDYGEGDPANGEKEIVIGNCSRSATQACLQELRYKDYSISLQDGSIVVAAHDDETAAKAVQKLVRMLNGNTEKAEKRVELTWPGDYRYQSMTYKLSDITLHGVSLKEYSIVYAAEDPIGASNAAMLQRSIGTLSGLALAIRSDGMAEEAHEILVGETNRSVDAYRALALEAMEYALTTDGEKLLIAGAFPFSTRKAIEAFEAYALNTRTGVLDGMHQRVSLLQNATFEKNSADIRIMEYNILVEFDGWGAGGAIPPEVELRKEIVASVINGYRPDVLCLCEFFETWRQQLPPLLDDCYRFVAIDRPDGSSNRTSLVYNAERLNLIDSGYEDISLYAGDVNKRVVMWGLFEEKTTGKQFLVLGTHYASETGAQGDDWRQQQADRTADLLQRLTERYSVPALIMGDLNSVKGQPGYDRLLSRTGFSDAMGAYAETLVDHILYAPDGLEQVWLIVEKEKLTAAASDHSPVLADFRFLE